MIAFWPPCLSRGRVAEIWVLVSAGNSSSINNLHSGWLRSATSEEELAAEQYLDHKPERGAAEPELGYGQVGARPLACPPSPPVRLSHHSCLLHWGSAVRVSTSLCPASNVPLHLLVGCFSHPRCL